MKIRFFAFLSLVLSLFGSALHAGNLKVDLAPTSAVSAGAQWRVDGGAWHSSGTTVSNLSNTTHVVSYNTVGGWIAPANANVTLSNGVTTTVTGTYISPAALKINLTPTTGRWRIDGGSWQIPGATVSGLTPGSHSVDYQAVSGYNAPATESVTLTAGQTTTLTRAYVQLAQLTVTLTPSTGQWRLDGGAWRNSGTTATGLTPGAHNLEFNAVSGYTTPAAESVSLTAGQSLALNRTYLTLPKLSITLSPTTGKWRIDSGSWQSSGALVSNLTAGNHTVDYLALTGYTAPASETVSLISGQTTTLTRAYVQLSQLTVTLSPTTGKWRVDGGTWLASGTVASNLAPGSHTVDYQALSGYIAPASEATTLVSGQTTTLSRTYIQLAQLTVTLSPTTGTWRVDGGAWLASGSTASNLTPGNHTVDYQGLAGFTAPASETVVLVPGQTKTLTRAYVQLAQVSITLTPTTGSWRVDGGAWLASGAVAGNLAPGNHTIDYAAVAGFTAPASESVTLVGGQSLPLARSYAAFPQLSIVLSPAAAQWRVDGGAWQASGASLTLTAGTHSVEYAARNDWIAPATESVTLASGQVLSLNRNYTPVALLVVVLDPSSAQWRLDGGTWTASGAPIANIPLGTHTIEYSTLAGYTAPPTESVVLAGGINPTITRSYTLLATFVVTLNPTSAQWRIDGGAWNASGSSFTTLALGAHTIEYSAVSGYITPPSESVTLVSGINPPLTRTYTQFASFGVTLNPANAQWRMVGAAGTSAWFTSGTSFTQIPPGAYTIEFSDVQGYITPTPAAITLVGGSNPPLTRTYAPLASFGVTLNPANAQWRMVGAPGTSAWFNSGASFTQIALGTYTIEFSDVAGYVMPNSEVVTLVSGPNPTLTRSYTAFATLAITLNPSAAQWRVDGGAWQSSGATLSLPPGSHSIEYSALVDFDSPANETVNLSSGDSLTLSRDYTTQKPTLRVNVTTPINGPWHGQWRIDGGVWRNSGTTASDLTAGTHTLDYTDLGEPWQPLASESVTLALRENATISRTYALKPLAALTITLDPAAAQWRLDGGAWQPSGATVGSLDYDVSHTIEYAPAAGFTAPPSEFITLASGQSLSLNRSYVPITQISITLTPSTGQWIGQWRVDGGDWQASGAVVTDLAPGAHTISYFPLPVYADYQTPPDEAVTLSLGQSLTLSREYAKLAAFYVILNPASAQWRIDGGAWTAGGIDFPRYSLSLGNHLVEYSAVPGYAAPPSETVTLVAGANGPITRNYTLLASFGVTLTPASAQWRIDGGNWNASGVTLTGLALGTHLVEYSAVPGYIAPPPDNITLVSGANPPRERVYIQLATFGVVITPTSGQWRIDGGSWNIGGSFLNNLTPGAHTIEYSPVVGYVTPPNDSVTLVSGVNLPLARTYVKLASVHVMTTPSSTQWRVDGGNWQISGPTTLNNLTFGVPHIVEFGDLTGYVTPPPQTITLSSGELREITATYQKLASVHVNTTPNYTQWRIDGGYWQISGPSTVNNLAFGVPHTVEFSDLSGYVTPPAQTFTLAVGELREISATYQKLASVHVMTTPGYTQWRIDGGYWQISGPSTVNNLAFGVPHTVEFSDLSGYVTPPAQTFTLAVGEVREISATYQKLASVHVNTTPNYVQWRIDGGYWQMSGSSTVNNLAFDVPHLIEFSDIMGYVTPPAQTITLTVGELREITATYQQLASVHVTTTPNYMQWRIDGGYWQMSGSSTVNNLSFGVPHTVEFGNYSGYGTPPSQTITLSPGELREVTASYTQLASLSVSLDPSFAMWRVDGNRWNLSGTAASNLAMGGHTLEFSHHEGYLTPPTETITLSSSSNSLSRTYAVDPAFSIDPSLATFTAVLDPKYAEWRLDGGDWNVSGSSLHNLTLGTHTIEYKPVADYIEPPTESVTLVAGNNPTLYTEYISIDPAQLTVTTTPGTGQWRAYLAQWPAGGAWRASGTTATGLNPGTYTIEYAPLTGYVPPVNGTVELLPDGNRSLTASYYITNASVKVTLTPATARWRINGGVWRVGNGMSWISIYPGTYTLEFEAVAGYTAPAATTITLTSGQNQEYTFTYTPQ